MATTVKTEEQVTVKTSAKLIASIREYDAAKVKLSSKKREVAETIVVEAKLYGYNEAQANTMASLCWIAAFNMEAKSKEEKAAFLKVQGPDISKIIRLAFPKTPQAKTELQKAYAHNDKLGTKAPKQSRIGENNLLEIARGNKTYQDVITVKEHKRKQRSTGALEAVTPAKERFANAIKGLFIAFKTNQKNGLTMAECDEAYANAKASYTQPTTETAAKK